MKKNYRKFLSAALLSVVGFSVNAQCPVPSGLTASPSTICTGATASLNATAVGGYSIGWYTAPTGGTSLGTSASGANFAVTPTVTTTYYAESYSIAISTATYNFTGGMQTYTVPMGVTQLTIDTRGAKGGDNGPYIGGNGGRMQGVLAVTPGQVLQIYVGGAGVTSSGATAPGGYNGGGNIVHHTGNGVAGTGGGSSDIRISPYTTNDRVAVAGGGGGGAYQTNGGNGGGLVGQNGVPFPSFPTSGGGGGSQSSGGIVGVSNSFCTGFATAGMFYQGGTGDGDGAGGGGGGSGYYGGGGGCFGGGGGGSSYSSSGVTSVVHSQGFQTGNGQILITGPTVSCVSASRTPITLTVNTTPTITVNNATVCNGQSYTITPTGASTYTYAGGGAVKSPTANTSYTVQGTSAAGCISNIATSNVTVNATPTVVATSSSLCAGSSFTIVASGASTYTFSSGSAVVTPSATNNYTVTGTATNGCTNSAISTVTVNANPVITVNSGVVCIGNSFTIVPSGASTYTIQGGNAVVTPTATSNYTVTGTSSVGCMGNTAQSTVTVNALPTINATSNNTLICTGQTASLTATGAATYSWNTGSTTAVIAVSPSVTTTYTVSGLAVNGCSNVTTVMQSVSLCTNINSTIVNRNLEILVYPNPSNGVFTIESETETNITITDLLGKVVYQATATNKKATINLTNLPNGLYILKTESTGIVKTIKLIKE